MADSFVFYRSFHLALSHLDGETYKKTMEMVCNYALDGIIPDCSGVSAMAFELIKPQIDANIRRRENGKKGGRPKVRNQEQDMDADEFRKSTEYKKWRDKVMALGGFKCAKCGTTEGNLNAHHIHNIFDYPEERLDVGNGMILCNSCHAEVHKIKNQQLTESKPKDNLDITKSEPNVNVNENDNVNVNENANVISIKDKDLIQEKDTIKDGDSKKEKVTKKKAAVVYYPNDDVLNRAFADYVEMRKMIKKPMTERAIELAIKRLDGLSGGNNDKAIDILNQSIFYSWQGLFEISDKWRQEKQRLQSLDEKWGNA